MPCQLQYPRGRCSQVRRSCSHGLSKARTGGHVDALKPVGQPQVRVEAKARPASRGGGDSSQCPGLSTSVLRPKTRKMVVTLASVTKVEQDARLTARSVPRDYWARCRRPQEGVTDIEYLLKRKRCSAAPFLNPPETLGVCCIRPLVAVCPYREALELIRHRAALGPALHLCTRRG